MVVDMLYLKDSEEVLAMYPTDSVHTPHLNFVQFYHKNR